MSKIGGRRNYPTEDNSAREINAAVGRASIQQSDAIEFAVLNRSLVEVEKQLNEVKDRKRRLGKLLYENFEITCCDNGCINFFHDGT